MEKIITGINDVVWSNALIVLCLATGVYFSVRTKFLQVRYLREMIRLLFDNKASETGVSSFQAFSIAIAGRVGTGNIAGVATAIAMGGPGAIFWMWTIAFLGSASAFIEATLGQMYKEVKDGQYRGGPAYYIEKGLGMKWYAVVFAIATILSMTLLLPGVQSNSIAMGIKNAFPVDPAITGGGITLVLGLIIFGGVRKIFLREGFTCFSVCLAPVTNRTLPTTCNTCTPSDSVVEMKCTKRINNLKNVSR